jgi:hypothetical protein
VTHYRTLFDAGKYLGAWHLPKGKDVTVTIENVSGGELKVAGSTKATRKPIVKLVDKKLLWALNKTNAKSLERLYGTDVEAWAGKPVTLYVGRTRDPDGGGQCDCIRVRPGATGGTGAIDEAATKAEETHADE